MKKSALIFLIFNFQFSIFNLKAQFIDSLRASLERKGRFTFSFNSRNSFITNNTADIWGFMAGVCFDRKFAIGGGVNILISPIFKNETVDEKPVNAKLNFSYISYFIEYIFRVQKHWEIDIPLSMGAGTSSYSYSLAGSTVTQNSKFVMPVEPQVEVDYDFFRNHFGNYCFGLYVQAGYRYMLINNYSINENFNSPTYSYGILIFPFEIYSALFPRTGLAHLIETD